MKKTALIFSFLAIIVVSISLTVGGSMDDCPQPSVTEQTEDWEPITNQDLLVKSMNGTLYTMWEDASSPDRIELLMSTDGYNWSSIHEFDGKVYQSMMALNSTGILHMILNQGLTKFDHIVFNLTTMTNTSVTNDAITGSTPFGGKLIINSTDGLRMIMHDSKYGLYLYNGSVWDYVDLPGSAGFYTSMAIQTNDTLYIGTQGSSTNSVNMYSWDGAGFSDLGGGASGGVFGCGATDILMNNTSIMVTIIGLKVGGHDCRVFLSDLPAISWTIYTFPAAGSWNNPLWLNGSRLELMNSKTSEEVSFNFSYFFDGSWVEYKNITIWDSGDHTGHAILSRATRFHEPDFYSNTLDGIYTGFRSDYCYYFKIFPNATSSFLNLTVNTTYNELYSVNIDPKDLNPQDIIISILQDTNAEDDWLEYSGSMLSGTVGETDYGNTTVWVIISFDDGTVNFTYNFTFNSERVNLLNTTTLPHGYLNIHYRGTVSTANNTTWYAITNAGWASVDNTTGEITGYPRALGTFWFHIYVNDTNSNNTDDGNFTVVIGIHPGDIPSRITYLVTPIVIAVVGVVITVAILFGILRSMESTFNRFGKS